MAHGITDINPISVLRAVFLRQAHNHLTYITTTTMQAESSATVQTTSEPKPIAPSNLGRSVGKAHKSTKTALRRSYISPSIKTPFEKRKEKEKARDAVKAVEQEMREDEQAEKDRCVSGSTVRALLAGCLADMTSKRTAIRERREKQAERLRMEQMAAKMSAKKLQRLKKVRRVDVFHSCD